MDSFIAYKRFNIWCFLDDGEMTNVCLTKLHKLSQLSSSILEWCCRCDQLGHLAWNCSGNMLGDETSVPASSPQKLLDMVLPVKEVCIDGIQCVELVDTGCSRMFMSKSVYHLRRKREVKVLTPDKTHWDVMDLEEFSLECMVWIWLWSKCWSWWVKCLSSTFCWGWMPSNHWAESTLIEQVKCDSLRMMYQCIKHLWAWFQLAEVHVDHIMEVARWAEEQNTGIFCL